MSSLSVGLWWVYQFFRIFRRAYIQPHTLDLSLANIQSLTLNPQYLYANFALNQNVYGKMEDGTEEHVGGGREENFFKAKRLHVSLIQVVEMRIWDDLTAAGGLEAESNLQRNFGGGCINVREDSIVPVSRFCNITFCTTTFVTCIRTTWA